MNTSAQYIGFTLGAKAFMSAELTETERVCSVSYRRSFEPVSVDLHRYRDRYELEWESYVQECLWPDGPRIYMALRCAKLNLVIGWTKEMTGVAHDAIWRAARYAMAAEPIAFPKDFRKRYGQFIDYTCGTLFLRGVMEDRILANVAGSPLEGNIFPIAEFFAGHKPPLSTSTHVFKAGDVVTLKSGGAPMTVVGGNGTEVLTVYWGEQRFNRQIFGTECLVLNGI